MLECHFWADVKLRQSRVQASRASPVRKFVMEEWLAVSSSAADKPHPLLQNSLLVGLSNQFIDTKNETSPVPEEFAKKPFF